jgi:hypothetical protein
VCRRGHAERVRRLLLSLQGRNVRGRTSVSLDLEALSEYEVEAIVAATPGGSIEEADELEGTTWRCYGERLPGSEGHLMEPPVPRSVDSLDVPLERDVFLRSLISELTGTLQEVVGLQEASGFISVVGQNIGAAIDRDYKHHLRVDNLTPEQVADVLVDLKRRINGAFYVVEQTPEKIVFGNRRCPFEDKVAGRPALCMMTSNVFGSIAAENLGYAKVELRETIALGASQCRVVVHLKSTAESEGADGREYVKG